MIKQLVTATLIAASLGACYVDGNARVYAPAPVATVEVEEEPPAPRVYVAPVRAGFLYIDGRWERRGGRWAWREGYYERERVGYGWAPGRWERRGRGHVWVEGRWERRGR